MKKRYVVFGILGGLLILTMCSIFVLSSPGDFSEIGVVKDTSVSSELVCNYWILDKGSVINAEIDNQVYEGAKSPLSHRYSLFPESKEYRLRLIYEPLQEELMTDMVQQFRSIQYFEGMSNNEFVDMLVSYVQNDISLERGGLYPDYPLVTLIDSKGTLEEKAILLAGLLAYSGYDVVLLDFPEENNHVAVGIKNNLPQQYQLTGGYAVIEVGSPGWKVGQTKMTSSAEVTKVGSEKAVYVFGTLLNPS